MSERGPDLSRIERKKGRNRTNRMLNILIAVVVLLIVITASTIFLGNNNEKLAVEKDSIKTEDTNGGTKANDNSSENVAEGKTGSEADENTSKTKDDNKSDSSSGKESEDPAVNKDQEETDESIGNSSESGKVTYGPSDDKVIAETVVDTSWKPIGTTQTGEHTSLYDGASVDWKEKKQALAYATGLPEDSMIFWKIKNGGGPQKSVGVVSSRDSAQKYRVYLEWVDHEGWKPVKIDKLTTLDFDY
jgi:hypothetical protein